MPDLLALTVWQPWAWCLSIGWKPVENRPNPPPRAVLGRWAAIHAGALPPLGTLKDGSSSAAACDAAERIKATLADLWDDPRIGRPPLTSPGTLGAWWRDAGCILSVGIVAGWLDRDGPAVFGPAPEDRAAVKLANVSPWRSDSRFGIVYRAMVRLPEPVSERTACHQGWWRVPEPALSAVREGWRKARAA